MGMIEDLRKHVSELLENGRISALIGYAESTLKGKVRPFILFDARSAHKLIWDGRCDINLASFLMKEPILDLIKEGKRIGIVVKGCDLLSISVLIQENKIDRDLVYVIGVACGGMKDKSGQFLPKCKGCTVQVPEGCDLLIGSPDVPKIEGARYQDVTNLLNLTYEERWNFWIDQFSKCIRCYACRQACPLCYCQRCLTDMTMPQWVDKDPSVSGNLFFHFMRALHLAGRCVGCGECARACPMGIPIDVLTRLLCYEIENNYGYLSGADASAKPFLGTFSEDDPDVSIGGDK